jgi:hypothetical protein
MALFRFKSRTVADPLAQQNFEQLEGVDALGFRIVRGGITGTTGAVAFGTGFTCVRNAVGDYTITFSTAFPATPAVAGTATAWVMATTTLSATSWRVTVFNSTTGAALDRDFTFIAIG